tara:strand:+ start:291 stop:422 length:132 start_codon:yes stop_codon:yes gene_type:complete
LVRVKKPRKEKKHDKDKVVELSSVQELVPNDLRKNTEGRVDEE